MISMRVVAVVSLVAVAASNGPTNYRWARETDAAAWEGSYNFPVFVVRGEMWALHPRGAWRSADGRTWTRTELPPSGLNTGYQKYVQLGDAVYALGAMTGNYLDLHLSSRIARTRDLVHWEPLASESNLPARVFYAAVVFHEKIWLFGGFDGRGYFNDVWSSADAVHWTRVTEHAEWTPRDIGTAVVFRNRLWIVGGGVIDGQREINANSNREVWSSADGVEWTKSPDRAGAAWGGTPIVYDDQLWLVASNRNSTFAPSLVATADGITWREESAPWSPRGAPAVWEFGGKLFMAGGKYSVTENGAQRFIYRNDVWSMSKR